MKMIRLMEAFLCLWLVLCGFVLIRCDIPANCSYEETLGTWMFKLGRKHYDKSIDCYSHTDLHHSHVIVTLSKPDRAVDQYGNTGTWTLVYNQGFEVVVHGRKYFAFFKYIEDSDDVDGEEGRKRDKESVNYISICSKATPGWSHDLLGNNWACYLGIKISLDNQYTTVKKETKEKSKTISRQDKKRLYRRNQIYVDEINRSQSSWRATHYPEYESMTLGEIEAREGASQSINHHSSHRSVPHYIKKKVQELPESLDWRDVNGVNFVSPVRDQGACGSCYTFPTTAMMESRLRIMTDNEVNVTLSQEDIIQCDPYSQGCDGGHAILVGKYGEDYGFVEESCNPYASDHQETCQTSPSCKRFYSINYQFIGGYSGGCSKEGMLLAIYNNGPIHASLKSEPDFKHYKSGIFESTQLEDTMNPTSTFGHSVLLVGYGVDEPTGTKYWIAQNSWGVDWGEEGYFRVRRGTNEINIERSASEFMPLL